MVTPAAKYLSNRKWVTGVPGYTLSENGERSGCCIHLAIVASYNSDAEVRDNVAKVCKELGLKQLTAGALIRWNDFICGTKEQAIEALQRAGV